MCTALVICESSQCRISHTWGESGKGGDDEQWFPYSLVSLRRWACPIVPPALHRISTQWSEFSHLALRYGMRVLFQRQRQEVLLPPLETCDKKHSSIKKCAVPHHRPGDLQCPFTADHTEENDHHLKFTWRKIPNGFIWCWDCGSEWAVFFLHSVLASMFKKEVLSEYIFAVHFTAYCSNTLGD